MAGCQSPSAPAAPWKSEMTATMAPPRSVRAACSSAAARSLPVPCGCRCRRSCSRRRTCAPPRAGRSRYSVRSLKAIAPTRSRLAAAEKPSSPATSIAKRRTLRPVVPKPAERLTSSTISSVRSRSSTNSLT